MDKTHTHNGWRTFEYYQNNGKKINRIGKLIVNGD